MTVVVKREDINMSEDILIERGSKKANKIFVTEDYFPSIPTVAKFEKVSFEQFEKDMHIIFEDRADLFDIKFIYNSIKLPKRATKDSAGYDFFAPFPFKPTTDGIVIPTGIKCKIRTGWALKLYPRSGHGFRYGMYLYDTTGIIDGDYYYTEREGHIMVKIAARKECDFIDIGVGFCQGVFTPYGITIDDNATETRIGGFGSTSKK